MSTVDYLENLTSSGLALNASTLSDSAGITDHLVVFRAFVIVIGLFGSFMNGVVLSVLLSKKLRSKPAYLLIINQVVLDFLSCLFLLLSYAVKSRTIYLSGGWGRFLCILFIWDTGVFSFQAASVTNLVLIAVERYFKIVHVVFHRTYFKRWMSLVGLAFIWATVIVLDFHTVWAIEVVDGACYSTWLSGSSFLAYGIFIMTWEFVIPLILFVCLYGRIILFVRQRSKTLTENNTNNQMITTSLQTSAQRSQMNVTMTMIIVSTTFVTLRLPNHLFYLLVFIDAAYYRFFEVYYATVFLIFLNVCTNPLIYAVKHEEVKNRMKKWFFKAKVWPEVSTVAATISETASRAPQLTQSV